MENDAKNHEMEQKGKWTVDDPNENRTWRKLKSQQTETPSATSPGRPMEPLMFLGLQSASSQKISAEPPNGTHGQSKQGIDSTICTKLSCKYLWGKLDHLWSKRFLEKVLILQYIRHIRMRNFAMSLELHQGAIFISNGGLQLHSDSFLSKIREHEEK